MKMVIVLAGALALAGCDDKASTQAGDGAPAEKTTDKPSAAKKENRVASCQQKETDGFCRQWGEANIDGAGMEHLESMCEDLGKFSKAACPTEGSIGTCTTPEGIKVFYSGGKLDMKPEDAEKQCKEGIPAGTWKPS